MEEIIIILLVLLGVFLIVAEILFIPGLSVAAIGSAIAFIASIVMTYTLFGTTVALLLLVLCLILSGATIALCLRKKSLKKISLSDQIDSQSSVSAIEYTHVGAIGVAQTRLAPMGMVYVDGQTIEAKSIDGYIAEKSAVVVVGFENSVIIVKNQI